MKRKMVVTLAAATLALFILFIALPVFTAPATAANLPIVYDNQSDQNIESLAPPIDWTPYFNNRSFNFSPDFISSQYTHRWRMNTKFGLDFAKLIEFNDLNSDQIYNDTIDTFINEYNLRTDIVWSSANIEVNWTPGNTFPDSIQIVVTGQSTDPENTFQIEFLVTLYFEAKTITFNDTTVTVPAEVALKYGLNILGYDWAKDPAPNASRYLALVINLHACLGDSYQYRYRWANGEVVANGSSGLVPSLVNDESVSEVYFVDSWGNPVALFNWFNGAYNGSEYHDGCSYFCLRNETLTVSIAFSYNDFQEGNIYIDPYFQMLEGQNYIQTALTFSALSQVYSNQSVSTLLLYGGIAAAIVLIGMAIVLIRRR
ncbi:MAG: hypothetical protein ACUVXA_15655 [Candidatus Jordarchaeum sp.]|uniref:hypothetical protein n=1 Tax=Candidatus Jordarchaeum sp. TaxID=2823881 RepID=UPI0040493B61